MANVVAEQRATREAVAVYDQSSFGKLLVQGADSLALLETLAANAIDVPVGRIVYTPLLNARGGFESDLTIVRLAERRFLCITGSAQPTRDADWIERHAGTAFATVADVSALYTVLSVMGPNARELLARAGGGATTQALGALAFAHTGEVDIGMARVRAARMSYVGGPGFELYVPVEMARHVWLALHAASDGLGLVDAGYYALDALRIEAGRRAWGAELGPDETPLDAGTMFAVKLDKGSDFIGRQALVDKLGDAPARRLVTVVVDSPDAWLWGGEAISIEGEPSGEVTSAGWSLKAEACVALAYLRGDAARAAHGGTAVTVDVWGEAVAARAFDRWPPPARH